MREEGKRALWMERDWVGKRKEGSVDGEGGREGKRRAVYMGGRRKVSVGGERDRVRKDRSVYFEREAGGRKEDSMGGEAGGRKEEVWLETEGKRRAMWVKQEGGRKKGRLYQ